MNGSAARLLLDDEATDALFVLFVEPPRVAGPEVLRELQQAISGATKPVVAAFPAQDELRRQAPEGNFALIDYPESAAAVLGGPAEYADWKKRPLGRPPGPPAHRAR